MIEATDASGKSAYYPVVLRSPRPAPIAVVVPQFTWQAYNDYGGSGLYTADTTQPAGSLVHFASFERPFARAGGAGDLFDKQYSLELLVARWLERNGYDVSYISDADLANPTQPLVAGARVFVFAGHDEYWTWGEFDRIQGLRDTHHHLMFMSGNNAYWNVRVTESPLLRRPNQVVTCYKNSPDPGAGNSSDVTTRFRDSPLSRPENSLVGIMYMHGSGSAGNPLVLTDSNLTETGAAFLLSAGLQPGDSIPDVVGIEGDQVVDNGASPSDLQVLFQSPVPHRPGDTYESQIYYYTTFYVAPSGAGVFASGSNDYARGLDNLWGSVESPRLQSFTGVVLQWMLSH